MGTPTEQIGFQASEEYASRISSPRPQSASYHVAHSNASDGHLDSPLSKEPLTAESTGKSECEGTLSRNTNAPSDKALESEVEDSDVIHVDTPGHRTSKIYGGSGHGQSTEDLGPHTGHGGDEDGIYDEHGYSAPILASDEVAKEPFGWELQPAVSPLNERRAGSYEESNSHYRSGSASSVGGSRPSSRPGSIHGTLPGLKLPESTPLEDLHEYEPLFPDDEKNTTASEKPLTAADRLKRPELKSRKFPSQDIWEDTPNSLQYTATVSTPQLPEEVEESQRPSGVETSAQAFARRQEELAEKESNISESFLHKEKKTWANNTSLGTETRPNLAKQRFPSRDIWEDTPDSLQLQTTVAGPQTDEKEIASPQDEKPNNGAVEDHQENESAGLTPESEESQSTSEIAPTMKPSIPARPNKSKLSDSPEKSHPIVPERPSQRPRQAPSAEGASPPVPLKTKPQVPARPSKPISRESSENVPSIAAASNSATKSASYDTSAAAAAAAKPKPLVPSRPMGSKIAALQSGFMSDLNKRLQLGPQAPKKDEPVSEVQEEVKEKTPLVDARKGRARGPARRAPAKSPAPATTTTAIGEKPSELCFSITSTLWQIDPEEDLLHVGSEQKVIAPTKVSESETLTSATTTVSQTLPGSVEVAEDLSTPPHATEGLDAEDSEKAQSVPVTANADIDNVETTESKDEPPTTSQDTLASEPSLDEEDMSASTTTLKPSKDNVE
jgi:hypothetical protein